ncbi:MAG TPA: hypothetical protein VGZ27_02645 [Vicinamibacterales bacterium]|jgi:hypothetical protein|nr:hypothetical protein [Vicinamibacterales bacterium]
MSAARKFTIVIAIVVLVASLVGARNAVRRHRPDPDRVVPDGGVTAPGWKGVIDPQSIAQGRTINDSRFDQQRDGFHLTVGPAAYYWNPANTASRDFVVKATFTEPRMINNHPHPMGLFIGGSNLGTSEERLMYCTAYRDGSFIVRLFNGNHVTEVVAKTPNPAVHQAGDSEPVNQQIGWIVKGGRAECEINGTIVAGLDRTRIVGTGLLDSTDGIWGIRVSHNMDVVVTNLAMQAADRSQ